MSEIRTKKTSPAEFLEQLKNLLVGVNKNEPFEIVKQNIENGTKKKKTVRFSDEVNRQETLKVMKRTLFECSRQTHFDNQQQQFHHQQEQQQQLQEQQGADCLDSRENNPISSNYSSSNQNEAWDISLSIPPLMSIPSLHRVEELESDYQFYSSEDFESQQTFQNKKIKTCH